MEEEIAILMADLTGYTALTETHGSVSAADMIDRYIALVATCLVGDASLHETTGDEVMIVSSSPDSLLATALMLISKTSREENFLQIHGGLHYGTILKRRNKYFGSTINLTSRIAARADPGSFWCSDDFVNSLGNKSLANLHPKGKHGFKNINEEKEMFMIVPEHKQSFYIDPVCKMLLLDPSKATKHPESENLFFCSIDCLNTYTKKEPGKTGAYHNS